MLTKFFDYVYVINLATRPDRRAEMAAQLARLGLTFSAPGMVLFPAQRPANEGAFPSIGAHGCFLSHLEVLRDARRRQARSILLLEDDCDFFGAAKVESALEALRPVGGSAGWDMFYGGYALWEPPLRAPSPLVTMDPQVSPQTAHCVGFSARAIDLAVPYLEAMLRRRPGDPEGGPMHVDGAYGWLRAKHPHLKTLASNPKICTQRASKSDIATLSWYDTQALPKALMVPYRAVKRMVRRAAAIGS